MDESKIRKKIKDWLNRIGSYAQLDMAYFAKGGFWSFLTFLITSLLGLAVVVAFANLLPREIYGTYKYITALASSISFLTLSGMNTAVTQATARGVDNVLTYAVKKQLRWNSLYFLASLGLSIYYFVNHNDIFGFSVLILGITFPLTMALNTYGFFLLGKKEFKRGAIYGIIANAIYTVSMITAIYLTEQIILLVATYAVSNLVATLFLYRQTLKTYQPKKLAPEQAKSILSYGKHLSFINIFSTLSQYVDKITVFQFVGPAPLAVYSLALIMPDRIKGFLKSIENIIMPKLAEKDLKEIKKVFYKRTLQGLVIGLVLSLGYIILSPFVFKFLLPKYLDSIIYSQVLSLAFIILVPASYMGGVFYSQKMVKTIYLSSGGAHISRIILFVTLGALWGIWGVIAASLSVYLVGFIYNIFLWESALKKVHL